MKCSFPARLPAVGFPGSRVIRFLRESVLISAGFDTKQTRHVLNPLAGGLHAQQRIQGSRQASAPAKKEDVCHSLHTAAACQTQRWLQGKHPQTPLICDLDLRS